MLFSYFLVGCCETYPVLKLKKTVFFLQDFFDLWCYPWFKIPVFPYFSGGNGGVYVEVVIICYDRDPFIQISIKNTPVCACLVVGWRRPPTRVGRCCSVVSAVSTLVDRAEVNRWRFDQQVQAVDTSEYRKHQWCSCSINPRCYPSW